MVIVYFFFGGGGAGQIQMQVRDKGRNTTPITINHFSQFRLIQ